MFNAREPESAQHYNAILQHPRSAPCCRRFPPRFSRSTDRSFRALSAFLNLPIDSYINLREIHVDTLRASIWNLERTFGDLWSRLYDFYRISLYMRLWIFHNNLSILRCLYIAFYRNFVKFGWVHSKIDILLIATLSIQNDGNGRWKRLGKFLKVLKE